MRRGKSQKWLAVMLAIAMLMSMTTPMTAFAAEVGAEKAPDVVTTEEVTEEVPDSDASEEVTEEAPESGAADEATEEIPEADGTESDAEEAENDETEEVEEENTGAEEEVEEQSVETDMEISDYATFLSSLKVLEGYASTYANEHAGEDAVELVLNYIRTGVEKYTDGNWTILAGEEKTAFTTYVAEQDKNNGTAAAALKNITEFTLPNGQTVEFGHMFGCMNITYYMQKANPNAGSMYADLGGWGGDLCDLITFAKGKVSGDIEAMAKDIRENYLGADSGDSAGFDYVDIYGDLDAFYIINNVSGSKKISAVMTNYFNTNLTDKGRAEYFLKNRFGGGNSQEEVRKNVYKAYSTNDMIATLEGSEGITAEDADIRTASCYAFADYLYGLVGNLTDKESNKYYTVFSSESSNLAPGITQNIKQATTADNKQIVYYIATADVGRDDVSIFANYKDNQGGPPWGMQRVADQMAAAQERHSNPESENYIPNYNTIVGVNADFFNMSTGEPAGALVMEGVQYHNGSGKTFFGILKDGTPVIGGGNDWNLYKDQLQEAVGASTILVKDGKIAINESSNYYNSRASRTCVGITADNKVVLMVLDGRQEPVSVGGSMEELAQIMLDAGCVTALNLDGGGSTTFAAKEEGSNEVSIVNRPSDGYARSVSSSLVVVSTAKSSTEFDHAIISADYDYLTVGTELELTVSGVSASGNAAELPEGSVLQVSDETVGSMKDNVFTAKATGDVVVQLAADGKVLGSKTLHVVVPNKITFSKEVVNAVYGVPVTMPITVWYSGNPVAINTNDVMFGFLENGIPVFESTAGTFNGFEFTGNEKSGVRTVQSGAILNIGKELWELTPDEMAFVTINLYKEDEAMFDFDDVTGGDRMLAWNRSVSNATTSDDITYYIEDPDKAMETSYVFAVDMTSIPIPEKLLPLVSMLPGGDQADATAWGFLLQLAERVSVLTNVHVSVKVDPNFDVDYSKLKVVNEYFELTSAAYDEETGVLDVIVNFKDQTEAIDPATANPLCIVSGVKLTPKKDAAWENDRLTPVITGTVDYDIYLRASALYSLSQGKDFQETFGLYPYAHPTIASDKGAHFANQFIEITDSFTLDKTCKQGWVEESDGKMYYYKDNEALTGIQKLPDHEGGAAECYYDLGKTGASQGKISGLFELEDGKYYAKNGILQSGWQTVLGTGGKVSNYYLDTKTYKAVDGEQTIGGYHYQFTDCVLTRGDLVKNSTGTKYMWAGKWTSQQWMTIDGDEYYFRSSEYAATGIYAFNIDNKNVYYVFDESGVWMKNLTGMYTDKAGDTYWIEEGIKNMYPGLLFVDGAYYYFAYSQGSKLGVMVKDGTFWITKTNDLMPEGNYEFDKDGRMILPDQLKNGILMEDGEYYYYENGEKVFAGLVQVQDENGNNLYYYFDENGKAARSVSTDSNDYWVEKTNGLLPQWGYYFDENGIILHDDKFQNGIQKDEQGVLHYYIDGIKVHMGLFEVDGEYYYAKSSGALVVNGSYYCSRMNGLMKEGVYAFDTDGKLLPPEPAKNGIVEENGSLYYYVDGELNYAGLIQIGDDYYYVRTSGELVRGRDYWISKTNGLLPEQSYTFDENGKIVRDEAEKNGIVSEDNSLYYYENGFRTYAGLIQMDGNYYYVKSTGEVIHGRAYWITKTNNLLPEKSYTFDENGKLVLN